jgi:hypothetical protein
MPLKQITAEWKSAAIARDAGTASILNRKYSMVLYPFLLCELEATC